MKTGDINLLYEYNYWANGRILAAAAKVTAEQYAAPTSVGIGHRSLRATLVHILDGEWQWRITSEGFYRNHLTEGEYDATELRESQFPTFQALQERWQVEQGAMRKYLGSLDDGALNGVLHYTVPSGTVRERPLWHGLFHAVNHSTQHRSEAAALLTDYGQSPGDLDFTLFLNEHFGLPD